MYVCISIFNSCVCVYVCIKLCRHVICIKTPISFRSRPTMPKIQSLFLFQQLRQQALASGGSSFRAFGVRHSCKQTLVNSVPTYVCDRTPSTYMHANIHTYINTYIHTYIRNNIHTRTLTRERAHSYVHLERTSIGVQIPMT